MLGAFLSIKGTHEQVVVCQTRYVENLTIDLVGDGLGHITVHVEAIAGDCMYTRLSYTFTVDQIQLAQAIRLNREVATALIPSTVRQRRFLADA